MLKPAIVQDAATGRVLMLAWHDEEAERLTRETGEAWFWSRSRQKLWRKGETSGNTLSVVELRDDCDGDAVLLRVEPAGAACHTGSVSCFAPELWRTISERAKTTARRGRTRASCSRPASARARARSGRRPWSSALQRSTRATSRVVEEAADLVYHLYVLLAARGLDVAQLEDELRRRAQQ